LAEFNGVNLTKAGKILLAKAIAGKLLKFSRISCGDGILNDEQNPYEFTGLINKLYDLQIISCNVGYNTNGIIMPGVAELRAVFNNSNLEEGFYIREVGVFAEDPDTGEEVLYGYTNSGEKCDYMPEYGGADVVEFLYKFCVVIDQAEKVTAISASGLVYVTRDEFEKMFGENGVIIKEFWIRGEGDDRTFRPVGLPQVRVAIMGLQDLGTLQKQINEVAEATIQHALTFFDDIDKIIAAQVINHSQLKNILGNGEWHLSKQELKKLQKLDIKNTLAGNETDQPPSVHAVKNAIDTISLTPGPQGEQGLAATIQIGHVVTGLAGTSAQVFNSGTPQNAIFDFVIPHGAKGLKGDKGDPGDKGDKGDTGARGPQGPQGIQGPQGVAGANAIVSGSYGENGYVKFSNNLIIQWGYRSYTITGDDNEPLRLIKFPISFPTKCLNVSLTIGEVKSDATYKKNLFFQLIYDSVTTYGFYFYPQYADEVGDYNNPVRCYYIAIGY